VAVGFGNERIQKVYEVDKDDDGNHVLDYFFDVPGLNDTGVITQKIPGNHKKDRDCNADYAVYPIGVEAVYMGMNDKKSA